MAPRNDPDRSDGASNAFPPNDEPPLEEWLEGVRTALQARAAGIWRLDPDDALHGLAYAFHPELPFDVAAGFRRAAELVSLHAADLSIAQAARERRTVVSTVHAGPPGSRHWLSRFGAARSTAVPILRGADCLGVLSVATSTEGGEEQLLWRATESLMRRMERRSSL